MEIAETDANPEIEERQVEKQEDEQKEEEHTLQEEEQKYEQEEEEEEQEEEEDEEEEDEQSKYSEETEATPEHVLAFETIPVLRNHYIKKVDDANPDCPRMCKMQYKNNDYAASITQVEALPAPAHKKKKKTPVDSLRDWLSHVEAEVKSLRETVEEVVGEPFGEQPDGEADGQPDAEAVGQPYG
ncbi:hypothetical protein F2Q70_00022067 [Brassica cretica]|uniref:DUF287 domain-containing protein n=2 Tax=Brassica cretica TaxID=69181 RepID=A0A8S9GJ43_BRACR|nr:hypothetical protein F2Q70_00022067 [Brassica cretica]KAF2558582.1 hypothetical protein F2Q68_00015869 [Brassica cretica]KAF3609151.1 hypothetical protein DY000_02048420 [Brassica cretica]